MWLAPQSRGVRISFARSAAIAGLLAAAASVARADGLVLSRERVDRMLNAQIAAENLRAGQGLPTFVAVSRFVNGIDRGETVAQASAATEKSYATALGYQKGALDANDAPMPKVYTDTIKPLIKMTTPFLTKAPIVGGFVDQWSGIGGHLQDLAEAGMRDGGHDWSLKQVSRLNQLAADQAPGVIQRLIELHQQRPELRAEIESRFGVRLGIDFDKPPSENVKGSPLEPSLHFKRIEDMLAAGTTANGQLNVGLDAFKDAVRGSFDELNQTVKAQTTELGALQTEQAAQGRTLQAVVVQLDAQAQDEALRAARAQRQADFDFKLQGASSGVQLLSFLAQAGGDPKLGRQIEQVGMGTIHVIQSLDKFKNNVTTFSPSLGQAAARGISSAMLTADLIGIGLSVVTSFIDAGPTPEQMILTQIGEMRQQLDDVRMEMHDRFDQVDRQLISVHEEMIRGFDDVLAEIAKAQRDVTVVQQGVARLESMVRSLREEVAATATIQERLGVERTMADVLDGPTRDAAYDPGDEKFHKAQSDFIFHGTTFARSPVATASAAGRSYEPSKWAEEFDRGSELNLSYLAGVLARALRTGPGGEPKYPELAQYEQMGNPVDWQMGSIATMRLGYLYPRYLKGENETLIDGLLAEGGRISAFQRAVSRASDGKVRTDVLRDVVGVYDAAVADVLQAFESNRKSFVEQNHLEGIPLDRLPDPATYTFDVFAGRGRIAQAAGVEIREPRHPDWSAWGAAQGHNPAGPDTVPAGFSQGASVPDGLLARLPYDVQLAVQARVVNLAVAFDSVAWVGDHETGREWFTVNGNWGGRGAKITREQMIAQTDAIAGAGGGGGFGSIRVGSFSWKIEDDHLVSGKLEVRYKLTLTSVADPAAWSQTLSVATRTKAEYRHIRDTHRIVVTTNTTRPPFGPMRSSVKEKELHRAHYAVIADTDNVQRINDFDCMIARLQPADLEILSVDQPLTGTVSDPVRDALARLRTRNEQGVARLRDACYDGFAQSMYSGQYRDAALRLDGAQRFLVHFAHLAYPQEMQNNDLLGALVTGRDGAVDAGVLAWTIKRRASESLADLSADLRGRGKAIVDYVERPDAARRADEPQGIDAVETTLAQLRRFREYQSALNARTAGDYPSPDELIRRDVEAQLSAP